jgi:hypothetical protein
MRRDGRLRRWAWRIPLVIAVTAMLLAAAMAALGQRAVSDQLVVLGFAVGVISVPVWLVTGFKEEAR